MSVEPRTRPPAPVQDAPAVTLGQIFEQLFGPDAPIRFEAYDGSRAGNPDAALLMRLLTPRGVAYVATAPGSLGLARAYLQGDLEIEGVHPGDPYELLRTMESLHMRRPSPATAVQWLRSLGLGTFKPPPLPDLEQAPTRRLGFGLRHSRMRDASAISYHYDVSNEFYEMVLGPSMTYTCACYPSADATLEEAQEHKYDLVARKLGLTPGMRLLDVGCGWGGMVRHAVRNYGVSALGVTLSREQAAWASRRIEAEGLAGKAEVRHLDYREVSESGFDAVSSIGLIEHVGVKNYDAYFRFLKGKLRPGGRLLNHGIGRLRHSDPEAGAFSERFVFPDGAPLHLSRMLLALERAGFEPEHVEGFRSDYATTLRHWAERLDARLDDAVALAGRERVRVWRLYLRAARHGFESGFTSVFQARCRLRDA
jgi:cyclopropane-fatty-acyl-phospholipid synthase